MYIIEYNIVKTNDFNTKYYIIHLNMSVTTIDHNNQNNSNLLKLDLTINQLLSQKVFLFI